MDVEKLIAYYKDMLNEIDECEPETDSFEGFTKAVLLHMQEVYKSTIKALENYKNCTVTNASTTVEDEIFCQCAEECTELAQACLKMRRVLHGTTKVDKVTVQRSLSEELGDVLNCIEAILENDLAEVDMIQKAVKMHEFKKRLQKINGGET